jgi:hypothetical protein
MLSLLLFSACRAAPAQAVSPRDLGSVDADVTIVGRDDTIIPIPPPPTLQEMPLPELDLTPLEFLPVPAIAPPRGAWTPGSNDSPLAVLRRDGLI